jgi:hypothetical protein
MLFPVKFPCSKIIPTAETEIESIIHIPQSKNASDCDEIKSKILKSCTH